MEPGQTLTVQRHAQLPAIAKTCAQLYQETALMPLKGYLFFFHQADRFIDFCDLLTQEQRSAIGNICICFCSKPLRPRDDYSEECPWSRALTVERLSSFTGLKNLVVHMARDLKVTKNLDVSRQALRDDRIKALTSFRSLGLPSRSLTVKITPGLQMQSLSFYDVYCPPDYAESQRNFLRKVILGEVRDKRDG